MLGRATLDRSGRAAFVAAGIVALGLTFLVIASPGVPIATRNLNLHVALGTANAGVALIAALLVFGRFQPRRELRLLVQGASFLTFGMANLLFSVAPLVSGAANWVVFDTWAVLLARTLAALLLAVGALLPPWPLPPSLVRRAGWWTACAVGGSLALIGALMAVSLGDRATVTGAGPGTGTDSAAVLAHPAITALLLMGAVCYLGAAWGFSRQARAGVGSWAVWLGAASILAATGRIHGLLHPAIGGDVVTSDDLLRFGFYALVLAAAAREIRQDSVAAARTAAMEERRRVARDLHDGLAQELAFIRQQAEVLERRMPLPEARLIGNAARRALDESRRAIRTLSTPTEQPLGRMLVELASDVEARTGCRVEAKVMPELDVRSHLREELLRIAREALNNATRHSGADHVILALEPGDPLILRICDDGAGFDVEAARREPDGFGLTSMEERAAALGGRLRIHSEVGVGTDVEVAVPRDDRR